MTRPKTNQTVPVNYRLHAFHLFGVDLIIAGMASPQHNPLQANALLGYLRDAERTVLIGLHEDAEITRVAREAAACNGIAYYHFPIRDFSKKKISTKLFDDIYRAIQSATEAGLQVTVHCGAGDGRTGMAMATLKLRELIERDITLNPRALDDAPEVTESIALFGTPPSSAACTPLVKEAIEAIRRDRVGVFEEDSGSRSVETENDIETLMLYEAHLRSQVKKEKILQECSPLLRFDEQKIEEEPSFSSELHALHLFGREVQIAGMHGLQDPLALDTTLEQLSESAEKVVLIALCPLAKWSGVANAVLAHENIEPIYFPVENLSEEDAPELFEQVYAQVKQAIEAGSAVTIYTEAGSFGAETAFVALQLRERFESEGRLSESESPRDEAVEVHDDAGNPCFVSCTAAVKAVVEKTREEGEASDEEAGASPPPVRGHDVMALVAYEQYLQAEVLKAENTGGGLSASRRLSR